MTEHSYSLRMEIKSEDFHNAMERFWNRGIYVEQSDTSGLRVSVTGLHESSEPAMEVFIIDPERTDVKEAVPVAAWREGNSAGWRQGTPERIVLPKGAVVVPSCRRLFDIGSQKGTVLILDIPLFPKRVSFRGRGTVFLSWTEKKQGIEAPGLVSVETRRRHDSILLKTEGTE